MKANCILCAGFCLLSLPGFTQEFLGAENILKKVAEAANAEQVAEKKADPVSELRRKIDAFEKEGVSMPPAQAAAQWLALLDAYATIPQEALYGSDNYQEIPTMASLMQALPPSAAWSALADAIDRRAASGKGIRDGSLRLLSALLRSDGAARQAAEKALRASIEQDTKLEDYERENYLSQLDQMSQTLVRAMGTPAELVAAFEKELTERESKDEQVRQRHGGMLEVPDLVQSMGGGKGALLVKRALLLDEDVSFDGEETRALAAKIALENISQMKRARWSLVTTSADIPLYEAMTSKFPKGNADWERSTADAVYVLSLVATGQAEEAAKAAMSAVERAKGGGFSVTGEVLDSMQKQGLGGQVIAFLREMLTRDPSLPFWDDFIKLAAQESASGTALDFFEATLKNPKLNAASRGEVLSHHANALLAADKVEEGISVLRDLILAGPRSGAVDGGEKAEELKKQWAQLGVQLSPEQVRQYEAQAFGRTDSGGGEIVALGLRMSRLGRLLNRPELVDEGVAAAKAARLNIPPQESAGAHTESLVEWLVELKRGPEAEALILEELLKASVPAEGRGMMRGRTNVPELLGALAWTYQRAGRSADVVKLLDESSLWGQPDLADLQTMNMGATPLALTVAQAFAALGRKDEARKIALRVLQDYPGRDAAYALLFSVGGEGLEARLDQAYAQDRFEERPLIWKARLQLDAGRVDDAEKTVRAAIAIDPSDGEQGKSDRMRAYAVLAEVLEKKSDAEQAKIMRGAVAAIRLSESADDWWQAGLLTRAVKMYEEALKLFADAYCVQSRLALRYSQMGDFVKAEQHYRRAYELMPESFGRVESHCFGCEHIFSGSRAQDIAEKVFSGLTEKMPDRPQLFYLLGYLREEQGRFAEAAEQYRKAVKLDPAYLNAWKQLAGVAARTGMPKSERDDITLVTLRIDASGRHSTPDVSKVSDLGKLWDAILAAEASLPPRETGPMYPLAASRAVLAKKAADGSGGFQGGSSQTFFDRRAELRSRFTQHPLVNATSAFVDVVSRKR
jgi:tetratricopeptide (TPR) repeat protein